MKFGENLKQIRKEKNISQEELADRLGVARQSISKWETGENYPSMQNILCLCDIFKCKINAIVHEDFVDINYLDDEIKMSVVKFKSEKQKKVKVLSKILSIFGKIGSIIAKVGIGCIIAGMVVVAFVFKNIDVKDDRIVAAGTEMILKEESDDVVLVSKKNENVRIDIDDSDAEMIKASIEKYKKPTTIILTELAFTVIIVLLAFLDNVMTHFSKLFKNIHDGDTPFTLENVDHIKKMSYFMIASIVASTVAEVLFFITFKIDGTVNLNLFDLVHIIFLYALAYIFEYGYEIQRDSKGKIYGESEE